MGVNTLNSLIFFTALADGPSALASPGLEQNIVNGALYGALLTVLILAGFCAYFYRRLKTLQALTDNFPDPWCVFKGGAIQRASPAFMKNLGMEDVLNPILRDLSSRIHPLYQGEFEKQFLLLLSQKKSFLQRLKLKEGGQVFDVRGIGLGDRRVLWFQDVTQNVSRQDAQREEYAALVKKIQGKENILHRLPILIWERDENQNITFMNGAYEKVLNYAGDSQGLISKEIFDARKMKALARGAQNALDPKTLQVTTVVEGERRIFEVSEIPLGVDQGTIGFAIDLTETLKQQYQAEKLLESYKSILDKLSLAVALYGPDTRIEYYNEAYVQQNGFDEELLRSKPRLGELLEDLRYRRQLPEFVDFPAYKSKRLKDFSDLVEPREDLVHLPDERTLRMCSYPHPTGGIIFVFEDLTSHLLLERANQSLTAVQTTTFDNLFEGVAVISSSNRLKLFNASFAKLWNLSRKRVKEGMHLSELVEKIRPVLDKGGGSWDEIKNRIIENTTDRIPKNGEIYRNDGVVLLFSYVPLPNGDHLLSYIDITDSKNVTQALEERNEALELADRMKSEFIANISYELRSPLNTVVGFSEILSHQYFGTLNERQKDYVEGILDASNKLLHLINDILDLASIESGYMTIHLQETSLSQLLQELGHLVAPRLRASGLTLRQELGEGVDSWVLDARRIKQALFRLLTNAIKFTPSGGEILLKAHVQRGELVFEVTDTGIGMEEDEKQMIFKKFHKTKAGMEKGGAGLGLSLVKNLLELHGGRVSLTSAPGKGTAVQCVVPPGVAAELQEEAA